MEDIQKRCLNCMATKGDHKNCPECGHSGELKAEEPVHLKPGTVLNGKFLIGKVLGHGGFGITYLGWDMVLDIKLAIKEYFPQDLVSRTPEYNQVSVYTGDAQSHFQHGLQRFVEEAKVLAKFDEHPGIVSVRDYFQENKTAYMVMNYVEGMTLQEYVLEKGNILPWKIALSLMMPVLDALNEIHEAGILHRDISPDNIYITKTGRAKLLDFGAARAATLDQQKSLSVLLRPGYAPEEQYRTKGVQGPWTDVYAAAGTLYRLITGEVPSEALERMNEDSLSLKLNQLNKIPDRLKVVLKKALNIQSSNRYQCVKEFQQELLYLSGNEDNIDEPKRDATFENSNNVQIKSYKKEYKRLFPAPIKAILLLFFVGLILATATPNLSENTTEEQVRALEINGSMYTGGVKSGVPHGKGEMLFSGGATYVGEFLNGEFHGKGILKAPDRFEYEGDFYQGKMNGHGILYLQNGRKYVGQMRNDTMHGYGKLYINDVLYAEGEWVDGRLAD